MSDDEYEHDFENDNQNEDANKDEEEQDQEKHEEEENNQNEQEEQNNEQSQHNDNQEEDQNQDQQNQEQQDEDQQQQEDKEDNQESDAQEQEKEEIDNISEVQSKDESKLNDQSRINLESIDAVSVKVQDTNKKQSKKPTSAKPSSQQQMVGQLLKNHKEKQEKLKKKEDEIYIAEQVEKKKPKIIAPKPVTKQKLVFDKETKKKLEDPNIDNQKKAAILTKDLAKKLDKSVKIDEKTKKIEIKKPTERSEAKVKKNQFELRIGEGIKGKLEEDSEKADTKQLKNERQMFIEMKKATKKKMIEQLKEQDQMLKVKQAKQNEDQLKMKDKDTKVLKDNSEKLLEMKQMYQAQKQEIEQAKQEDEKQASKYEKDKLVALQRENESLKQELFKLERNIQECDQEIRQKQQHESVIPLGNDKYTSLKKLKLQGSSQQNTTMASISQASNASYSPENLSELGQVQISVKVLREIIKNGLEIADAYQLLDDDKDGVLTIQEVKNNLGRLNLNLEEQEIQKFIAELDDDSNGVLTQQEFMAYLTKNIQVQRKFEEIMGDIQDVQNPIILDERRLHIQFLKKYVIKQLEEEQNIEYTLKPQCNKILQKLKRYEKTYDKLKATDTNLYSLRKQLEKLRKELREQQERRDKAIQELDEKKEMILKNIDDLETELTDLSGKKYSLKLEAQDFTKLHQRLNLKLQAYKQIKRNYEKAIKENNNDELQRELQARRALDAQLQTEKQANELQRIKNQKDYQEQQKLQPQQEIQKSQVQESFQEEKQEDQYEEQQQQLQQPLVTKNYQRPQIGSLKFTSQMDDQFLNDIPSKGTPELPTLLPKQNGVPQQFSFQGEQQQETVKKQQLQIEVPKKQTKSKFQQEKQEQLVPQKQEQELSKSRTQLSQTFSDLDKLQKCLPSLIKVKKYIKQILHQEEPHDLIGDLGKLPLHDARCQFCLHELMTRICKSCMPKNFYCPECYEERHTNHKLRNHEFFFTKNDKKFNIK